MKLKKKYIIIICFILLTGILGFIYKGKSVSVSTKREEKLAKYEFKENTDAQCNKYYANYTELEDKDIFFNKLYQDDDEKKIYFQIIKQEYTNLTFDAYLINGCAWELDAFLVEYQKYYNGDVKSVCETLRTEALKDYNRKTIFNESLCVVDKEVKYRSDDTKKYEAIGSQKIELSNTGTDAIGDYYHWLDDPNKTKCYYEYSFEKTGKYCNYAFNGTDNIPVYLVNGCAWDLASYIDECNKIEENKCNDDSFKTFLGDNLSKKNNLSQHLYTYNTKCDNKINYGTVVVYENDDAYGLECKDWSYNESGSCKKSAIIETTMDGPDVTNLTKYSSRKFIGWSTSKNCDSIDISDNKFYVNFTGTKIYYACYEEQSNDLKLFENNGFVTIDEKYAYENGQCDTTNNGSITSTDIYYRKTTNNAINDKITNNNKYCNVVCEDEVKVSYPRVFSNVPAGQYFELTYEPEITATRICTEEINYDQWKVDYDAAVANEKEKMDELNKAQAYYDAAQELTDSKEHCCKCCAPGDKNCTPSYGKWDEKSEKYYTSNAKNLETIASYDVCNSSTKKDVQDAATNQLSTAKDNYKNAVNARIKLEKDNLQCYTLLDQDANSEKKYSSVFKTNYKINDIYNVNDFTYVIKADKVDGSYKGTSDIYANYIKNQLKGVDSSIENSLENANNTPIGDTVNFYAVYPQLTFSYDDGSEGNPQTSPNVSQKLSAEAHVKLDTGAYTDETEEGYKKDSTTYSSGEFYVDGEFGNHISFKAYTAKRIYRKVKYYFTYHESQEFFSKYQSGITTLEPLKDNNNKPKGYASLSRKETLTNKENNELEVLNNVYPVSLKAIHSKDYKISFTLSNEQNGTNNSASNSYFSNTTFGSGLTGNYTCSYEITNDALISSDDSDDYKKLKSNTIFRSVALDDIDPNNRSSTGKLGENWTNSKGKAVKESIENKESNNGTGSKYTYTDDNLEYSFTLTPTLIDYIKKYNEDNNYDDFKLTCATEDGRECVSEFLTNLSRGKVDGIGNYSNYSSINSWGFDDLVNTRKKWKYYNGSSSIIEEKESKVNEDGTIPKTNPAMSLNEYISNYEKWGVLP